MSAPFDGDDVSCAWVAPAVLADGTPAIRKLAIPHMEGEHELQALRFWDGDPTVLVLYSDDEIGAMLLERCEPGTALRALPEPAAGCGDRRATASTLARAISAAHVSSSVHPD